MSIQSELNELKIDKVAKLGSAQTLNKLSFKASEGQKIVKVLAVNASVQGGRVDVFTGSAKVECVLKAEAIVEFENGEFVTLPSTTNFVNALELASIREDQSISAKHFVIDVHAKHFTDDELEASIAVESVFNAILSEKINAVGKLQDAETDMETVCVSTAKSFISSKANVEISTTINASDAKIICATAEACIFANEAKGGYIDTKGKVFYSITYELKVGEDKHIKTTYGSQEFNHEIDSANVTKGANCAVVVNCVHIENKKHTASDKNCAVELEIIVDLTASVFETTSAAVLSDAFSCEKELLITRETFESHQPVLTKCYTDNVSGSIVLADNENRVHKVLATAGSTVSLAKSYIEDETLVLEGIINTTIIYLNEDEKLNGGLTAEVPFMTKLKIDLPENFAHVNVDACIAEISAKAKKGKEIEIDATLCITAVVYESVRTTMITGIKEGEDLQRKQNAINIFIISYPCTLWALCKMYQMPRAKMLEQNPHLAEMNVIPAGTRIVIYNQK